MKQLVLNANTVFAPVSAVKNQQPAYVYCSRRIGLYHSDTGLPSLNINDVFAKFAQLETEVNSNLVKMDEALKPSLSHAGLLTRDARIKERKKPGLKRARKAPTYTKR